jgi:hypothetical protein
MKLARMIGYIAGGAAAGAAVSYGIAKLTGRDRGREDAAAQPAAPERLMVLVTENGRKYHRAQCPLLHGETRLISVSDAQNGYEPCKACHPPTGLEDLDEGFRVVGRTHPSPVSEGA